jgi:hypothetical protein
MKHARNTEMNGKEKKTKKAHAAHGVGLEAHFGWYSLFLFFICVPSVSPPWAIFPAGEKCRVALGGPPPRAPTDPYVRG